MKTKYFCEMCNKEFVTEREAIECEKRHEDEKRKKKEAEKNKDFLIEQANQHLVYAMNCVNELRKAYTGTYIDIDYVGGIAKVRIPKTFEEFVSLLLQDIEE